MTMYPCPVHGYTETKHMNCSPYGRENKSAAKPPKPVFNSRSGSAEVSPRNTWLVIIAICGLLTTVFSSIALQTSTELLRRDENRDERFQKMLDTAVLELKVEWKGREANVMQSIAEHEKDREEAQTLLFKTSESITESNELAKEMYVTNRQLKALSR